MSLPKDWIPRGYLSHDAIYDDPPLSPNGERNWLIGLIEGDERHRIYDVPACASFGDIARAFRVGSHGANSYGYDESETIEMVAQKLDVNQGIALGRVVFADEAGYKVRFSKPISSDDYILIEALFPEDDAMQAGLESYISEWSGEGHPLAPLCGSDLLHLWWD
jgi:hypothetical protein